MTHVTLYFPTTWQDHRSYTTFATGLVWSNHADGGRWHVMATRVHLAPDMAIEGQLSADNNKMKKGTN